MSGGAFNYKEYVFDEIIDAIDEMIKKLDIKDEE